MGLRSSPTKRALLIGGALLLVAVLRFMWLGHESLWVDEAASVLQSRGDLGTLFRLTAADNYPPLHNLVLWVVIHLFGDGELAVRVPSALAGIATAWLAGRIALRLYGPRAEPIAIVLVGVSLLHLQYAQEARMYALLSATAAWSVLALLRCLERLTARRAVAWVVATTLCLYTHYYAVFIVVAEAAFVLLERWRTEPENRPNLSRWLALNMIVGVLFLPWLSTMLARVGVIASDFWIKRPSPRFDAASDYFALAWPLALALIICAVLPRLPFVDRERSAPTARASRLLLLWWLTTLVVPFVLSFVIQPFLIIRYTLAGTTAAYILVAGGVRRLGLRVRYELILVLLLVLLQLPMLRAYYQREKRPPWRDVAALIAPALGPGDRVLAWPNYERTPLAYYLPAATSIGVLPPLERLEGASGEAYVAKVAHVRGSVWLVEIGQQDPAGLALIRAVLARGRTLERHDAVGKRITIERYGPPGARPRTEYNPAP